MTREENGEQISDARLFQSRLNAGQSPEAALDDLHPGDEFIDREADGRTEIVFRDNSRATVHRNGSCETDEHGWCP